MEEKSNASNNRIIGQKRMNSQIDSFEKFDVNTKLYELYHENNAKKVIIESMQKKIDYLNKKNHLIFNEYENQKSKIIAMQNEIDEYKENIGKLVDIYIKKCNSTNNVINSNSDEISSNIHKFLNLYIDNKNIESENQNIRTEIENIKKNNNTLLQLSTIMYDKLNKLIDKKEKPKNNK